LWAQRPNIWLLDEPLVGLDPEGQREVLRSLQELQPTSATLLVTAAHLDTSLPFASAILLEEGQLSDAIDLTDIPEQRQIEVGLRPPPEARGAFIESQSDIKPSYALELHHLRFAYPEGPAVLHDLNLAVPQGQCVALVGPNGAGKSTLVRHFNGLLRPTSGSVHVMGKATGQRAIGQLARDVSFLFQRPERQLFAKTVREEIAYGPQQLGLRHIEARVAHSLSHFDLEAVADHPPALLSYGAQRTVTLASLAALDTPILVLDEPLVGLDGQGRAQLFRWLAERRAAGVTLVIVTHEMELARHTDRVVALQAGQIIADGAPDTVLSQLSWERVNEETTS
jgi:energy-coupling factor transport system ATP-binding protein